MRLPRLRKLLGLAQAHTNRVEQIGTGFVMVVGGVASLVGGITAVMNAIDPPKAEDD